MTKQDDIKTINDTLINQFNNFKTLMQQAADTTTWESYSERWAAEHDDNNDYNTHLILNIDKKDDLDWRLEDYTDADSYAQQQLHRLQESTTTGHNKTQTKSEIEWITLWSKLMHVEYSNFLADVTIDEETLDDKWDRVREELKEEYMDDIKEEYADYAETDEEWSRGYADYWRMDEECEPDEDFVTNWLYENC